MKLKHAHQELKTKQAEVKKMDSGYKKDQDAFEAVKKQKEKLESEMNKLNYEGLLKGLNDVGLDCCWEWIEARNGERTYKIMSCIEDSTSSQQTQKYSICKI